MAMSSSCGTSNLAAADRNSLLKAVLEWARTRPLALPSKTAPASPVPLNLRKSRRRMLELILEVGSTSSGGVSEHSEHISPPSQARTQHATCSGAVAQVKGNHGLRRDGQLELT